MPVPDSLGDYRVIEEIGRGGFGIVYRAHQQSLDRPVALKVLYRHLIHTQEQISRFEREARAAARLDHPSIVSVYAWGEANDDFYIAQRLIGSGRTMADELDRFREDGAVPKGWFRRVAKDLSYIAEGLAQAHDRGIVHRDVKPSNILLDEHLAPSLGDFGLAKVEDGLELSRTGDFAGSPYYMAPEQADSRVGEVDHRSDVYALGVTLYEMVTLTQPFQGTTSAEIMRKILTEDPKPPSKVESRMPADLETICMKAMEKNPMRRYPSALEFANDLHAFLDGEPISAVPIGRTRRLVRRARRHTAVLTGVVLSTLFAVALYFAVQGSQERNDELQNRADQATNQATEATNALADLSTASVAQKAVAEAETEKQQAAAEAQQKIDEAEGNDELIEEIEKELDDKQKNIDAKYSQLTDAAMTLIDRADPLRLRQMGQALFEGGVSAALGVLSPESKDAVDSIADSETAADFELIVDGFGNIRAVSREDALAEGATGRTPAALNLPGEAAPVARGPGEIAPPSRSAPQKPTPESEEETGNPLVSFFSAIGLMDDDEGEDDEEEGEGDGEDEESVDEPSTDDVVEDGTTPASDDDSGEG